MSEWSTWTLTSGLLYTISRNLDNAYIDFLINFIFWVSKRVTINLKIWKKDRIKKVKNKIKNCFLKNLLSKTTERQQAGRGAPVKRDFYHFCYHLSPISCFWETLQSKLTYKKSFNDNFIRPGVTFKKLSRQNKIQMTMY